MTDNHVHALGEALAEAVRQPDEAGERRALAAFRAARDSGALVAEPRRRDDWRPRRRRARWSVRTMVGAAVGGLMVGGVAVAGIGTVATPDEPGERVRPTRTVSPPESSAPPSPVRNPASAAPTGTPTPTPTHPEQARDDEARCKAYEDGHGTNRSERAAQGCESPSADAAVGSGAAKTPPGTAHRHDEK
ncbi:hypothetical protein GTY65_31015 [Streptomyces sp. SID8379]|uniref:hypothetical protein n=1 Tax=unclassified Streptomyces TaxID=2593676 RepID=UPI00036B350D|nr:MULTISPECIES: hypothetical protein [unclassified Streptomyces]MYW68474.1 hypothetical protein [Streptomyces sp. SID8379]